MSEPQFIPSSIPHSVEMPEGSHVAKSKSGQAGTEVRRTEQDHFAQDQEIEVEAHQVLMATTAAASENKVKLPPRDNIERASKPLQPSSPSGSAARKKTTPADNGEGNERPVYETEMPEMNFPARLIHLKLENDAVRAQLESLQSLLQKDET
jgi:hypothetical protein